MADESKTYLVNVESNLAQYAEDAAKAKKEVDELTEANELLKKSGASQQEIEASNAALKAKNEEYRKAQSLLKTAIQLNQSEAGSRKALGEQLKLQEQALGKLGNAYITDAKGIRVLNPLYTEQRNQIAKTKQAIIDYDLSLKDGSSNIGRYGDAVKQAVGNISALPGPLGRAAGATQSFVSSFARITPLGGIITGVLAAVSAPLIAFFSKSEEGIELLERKLSGLKASISVLIGELIKLGKSMVGEKGDEASPWGTRLVKGLRLISTTANFIPAVRKYFDDLAERMDAAGAAAEGYTRKMQELEDWERDMIVPRAKANLLIKESMLIYTDENKTIEERISALKRALDTETKTLDDEIKLQQFKILTLRDANVELEKTGQLRDTDKTKLQQAIAEEIKLVEESAGRKITVAKRIATAEAEIVADAEKKAKAKKDAEDKIRKENEKKIKEDIKKAEQYAEDKWQFEMKLGRQMFQRNQEMADQLYQDNEDRLEKEVKSEEARQKIKQDIIMAGFRGAEAGANAIFESKRNRLNAEMTAELSNANLTEEQKVEINKKYAKLQQKTDITQAIINGALAVGNALATTKPFFPTALIAATIAAVQSAAQVAIIRSQSYEGGGGSSVPTALSMPSSTVQRSFASNQGSTIFTQPQLSQGQLNSLPNQNLLTANDIAAALEMMPAPIVTVEDINAKVASKNKVEVRANI